MSVWDSYPPSYRAKEIIEILRATRAGECVSIVGLSGSGKSNLLGFLAHRQSLFNPSPKYILLDCNRLSDASPQSLFHQMRVLVKEVQGDQPSLPIEQDEFTHLGQDLAHLSTAWPGSCFLIDRFEVLTHSGTASQSISTLRSLRDSFKYWLTLAIGSRNPLDPQTELAELFYGHTIWLGPLSESDARWSIDHYAARTGQEWDEQTIQTLIELSWGYPSLLRAMCEAYAAGAPLELSALQVHPAIEHRLTEFRADRPDEKAIRNSGMQGHPLLSIAVKPVQSGLSIDEGQLTVKEHLLLEYLRSRPGQVCEKDDLIHAVWPEDKIFQEGIRDDSLAQLVRRLRVKIEPNPAAPRYIQAIPGRGYRFIPDGNA